MSELSGLSIDVAARMQTARTSSSSVLAWCESVEQRLSRIDTDDLSPPYALDHRRLTDELARLRLSVHGAGEYSIAPLLRTVGSTLSTHGTASGT